jgi:hypothetical protein
VVAVSDGRSEDDVPELVIRDADAAILTLLRQLQAALLLHPEAGQALYGWLAQEGRLFGQTEDGRRWRDRIERSALLERALLVWQNAAMWMTDETPDGGAPSALIDAVAAAAMSPRRDALVERLFRELERE